MPTEKHAEGSFVTGLLVVTARPVNGSRLADIGPRLGSLGRAHLGTTRSSKDVQKLCTILTPLVMVELPHMATS